MNRRGFFSLVGRSTAAAAAAPYLAPLKLFVFHPVIHMRRMMARIRITQEAMDDSNQGAFTRAARAESAALIRGMNRREERAFLQPTKGWFWR